MGALTIGRLNRRIRIERVTRTPDPEYGTPVETWSTHAVVWCNWQEVLPSKSESVVQGVRIATLPVRIRIRYLRGLTSDMRVKRPWGSIPWGSRHWWLDSEVFKIVGGPTELGNRDGIEMMIQLFTSDGQGA